MQQLRHPILDCQVQVAAPRLLVQLPVNTHPKKQQMQAQALVTHAGDQDCIPMLLASA